MLSQTVFCRYLTSLDNHMVDLSPRQLKQKETIIDNLVFDPGQNVDTVFNKIQEFNDLCTLLGNGKTDMQLVTYAYLIFQKTGIFMDGLKVWNSKASNLKTFVNFKVHMRKEYSDLQDVGGLTIQNTMPNQANMIQELKDHQVLMSNNLKQEFENNLAHTLQALSLIDENKENMNYQLNEQFIPQNEEQETMMMNMKSKRDPIIDQLMKQMTVMSNQIQALSGGNNMNTRAGQSGSSSSHINPKTGQEWKRYCWSCGCCAHWGKNCPNKKKGHENEATFKNRMNGSDHNCL